eukprot:Pgem_evm1s3153
MNQFFQNLDIQLKSIITPSSSRSKIKLNQFDNYIHDDLLIIKKYLLEDLQLLLDMEIAEKMIKTDKLLYQWYQREQQEIEDRKLAINLNENESLEHKNKNNNINDNNSLIVKDISDFLEQQQHAEILRNIEDIDIDDEMGLEIFEECVCCLESKHVYKLNCEHSFCLICLQNLFNASLKDRELIPLKCCRIDIENDLINIAATSEKGLEKYNQFLMETKIVKVVYCSNNECSLLLSNIVSSNQIKIQCNECGTATCSFCTENYHGEDTSKCNETKAINTAMSKMMETAGWKPCPRCRRLVSLGVGCHHITCICKMEFCYVCQKEWRTCACVLWEERRLYDDAVAQIDTELEGHERVLRIQNIMNENRHVELPLCQ